MRTVLSVLVGVTVWALWHAGRPDLAVAFFAGIVTFGLDVIITRGRGNA